MKILLFILGVCCSVGYIRADGPGFTRVEFTIDLKKGKAVKGIADVYDFEQYKDSLNNSEFMMRVMTWQSGEDRPDSLLFYTHTFYYTYARQEGTDVTNYTSCQLVGEKGVPFSAIKKIRIDKYTPMACGGIVNTMKMADTTWANKKPLRVLTLNGYLCGFEVFIHETNPKVDAIIAELEARQSAFGENLETVDEEEYQVDNEFFDILHKLQGEKVVVLESCTC